jgi:tetratricopeptide (TPR) repeat protein
VVAVCALGVLTWIQSNVWQSTGTLWAHVLERDPESSNANNSFGYVLMNERGELDTAIVHFRKALEVNPKNVEAWQNQWNALKQLNRDVDYDAALRAGMTSELPQIRFESAYRLGNIYFGRQAWPEAIAAFELALRNGVDARAYTNLSLAISRLTADTEAMRWDEAEFYAREAIKTDPGLINARFALVRALHGQQRRSEALAVARGALQMNPDSDTARRWVERLQP